MADYWLLIYAIVTVSLLPARPVYLLRDTRELKLSHLEDMGDPANRKKRKLLLVRIVGHVMGIVLLCIAASVAFYLYRSQQQESIIALSTIPGCAHLWGLCIDHCVALAVTTTAPSIRLPASGQACFALCGIVALILGSTLPNLPFDQRHLLSGVFGAMVVNTAFTLFCVCRRARDMLTPLTVWRWIICTSVLSSLAHIVACTLIEVGQLEMIWTIYAFADIVHFPYSAIFNGFVSIIKTRHFETPPPRSACWCIGLEDHQKQLIAPSQVENPHFDSDRDTQATSSSTTLVRAG